MNILCLYWVGDFRGRDFTINDVERLYRSVRKHIDRPFKFYCLTNSNEGFPGYIYPIPLLHDWPGWWSKIEIHRPDLPKGRTLYLDLDSHVIRSLKPILDFKGDLVMFPDMAGVVRRNDVVKRYQAATMLFDVGTEYMKGVWNKFRVNPDKWMSMYRSDQDVMGDWIPSQPLFPREWKIKLGSCRGMVEAPKDVIIVTGQTKDHLFRNTDQIPWLEKMARE